MNLSPEIIKMREALLERIGDKSLKEVAQIVNEILLNETDSTNRLAALAARVKVLRNYINKNYDIKNKPKKSKINIIKENDQPSKEATDYEDEKWVRVEMLKSGVVNGVRFPEGVVIDVNKNDADKLEENKLAKIIDATQKKEEAKEEEKVEAKEEEKVEAKEEEKVEAKEEEKVEAKEEKVEAKEEEKVEAKEEKVEAKEEEKVEAKEEKLEAKEEEKVEAKEEVKEKERLKVDDITKVDDLDANTDKKIIKTKSTKITEETIELTDPKAVAEALGLNEKKKKEEEPTEIEEEIDIEAIETGKKK